MVHTRWFRILVCLVVLFSLQGLHTCSRSVEPAAAEGACPAATLRWESTHNAGERRLSRYDYLLKKYAARIGMDWRLLAAIVYHESKFNEQALSPMGAKGLMQLRDVTALHFDRPEARLYDPEENMELGTMLLEELFEQFRREGVAEEDIVRFALASYNVGGGALARRRAEADSLGLDPNSWSAVASIFDLEDHSTPAYIDAVEQTYARYCQRF
jgi:membrane-bound lytic murein transglycosylase F